MNKLVESEFFTRENPLRWQMTYGERLALVSLLRQRRPRVSIEIGTSQGGSLQAISAASESVYSLDHDPTTQARLGAHFKNVRFIMGNSAHTLPKLLGELRTSKTAYQFALIDGDHSAEGARRDIRAFLNDGPPLEKVWLVIHDAANPTVREGIRTAGWANCPYVHFIDLDFVQGMYHAGQGGARGMMWGGFAVAILMPEKRTEPLRVWQGQEEFLQQLAK